MIQDNIHVHAGDDICRKSTTDKMDLAVSTGEIRYGGIGFLYGLGDDGIPTDNVLAALVHPQVAVQKAPNGLQHRNGDAIKVSNLWKRVGGKEIQVNRFTFLQVKRKI